MRGREREWAGRGGESKEERWRERGKERKNREID